MTVNKNAFQLRNASNTVCACVCVGFTYAAFFCRYILLALYQTCY